MQLLTEVIGNDDSESGEQRAEEDSRVGGGGVLRRGEQLLSFRGWREGNERNPSHVATEQPRATSSWSGNNSNVLVLEYATEGTKALLEIDVKVLVQAIRARYDTSTIKKFLTREGTPSP